MGKLLALNTLANAASWLAEALADNDITVEYLIDLGRCRVLELHAGIPNELIMLPQGVNSPGLYHTPIWDGLVDFDSASCHVLQTQGALLTTEVELNGFIYPLRQEVKITTDMLRIKKVVLEGYVAKWRGGSLRASVPATEKPQHSGAPHKHGTPEEGDAAAVLIESDKNLASPACALFRAMLNLSANEVSIEFVAGDSGTVLLNVAARGKTRRVALIELELVDRRKAEMNFQGGILLGMAHKKKLRAIENNAKHVSRLRKSLRKHLGIRGDPFNDYHTETGYTPRFMITDSRKAADERAKREAERKTDSLEEIYKAGDADKWLKDNDPEAFD